MFFHNKCNGIIDNITTNLDQRYDRTIQSPLDAKMPMEYVNLCGPYNDLLDVKLAASIICCHCPDYINDVLGLLLLEFTKTPADLYLLL